MWSKTFDKISFLSLFFVVVLLPVFFLPFTKISIETSKGLLLVLGLAISVIFWALARVSDGKIVLPKSLGLLSLCGIVLVTLASAIWSAAPKTSFFGSMFDIGSFWFIFATFILVLFCSIIFGDKEKARSVLLGVIISSAAVFVFQALRFYFPEFLSLGTLSGKLHNTVGSWNALGIFAGLSTLISLFILEFFSVSRMGKLFLSGLLVLSILLVAAVSFTFVWKVLGVSALIIFVYKVSFSGSQGTEESKRIYFPALSFAIVMLSLLFLISGQSIGRFIPNRLGLANTEVGPNFKATLQSTKEVLKKDPVLGLGPNMFQQSWAMYKPKEVNNTLFWNTSFNVGSGLFPTLFATTGALGIVAWLLFFGVFLWSGSKSLFYNLREGLNTEMAIFFICTLYLFISSFFYFTGATIFLLSMAFMGIFTGLHARSKENGILTFTFFNDHRKSFFSILACMLVVILSASLLFKYAERFTSIFYFEKALAAETIPLSESAIRSALSLYTNDLYLRTYTQILLIKLNSVTSKESPLTETEKTDLQKNFDEALASASLAIAFNPSSYLNFEALAQVYSNAAALGVKDSYERAVEAYNIVTTLSPLSPITKFALARVSLATGKLKEAKNYANEALALKADYTDALILLSQIAKKEGNNKDALSYAEAALATAPNNADIIQYVNSLKNPPTPTTPKEEAKDIKETPKNDESKEE